MTAEEVAAAIRSGEMVIKMHTYKCTNLLDDHFPLLANSLPVLQSVTYFFDDLLPVGKFLVCSILVLLYVLVIFASREIPSQCCYSMIELALLTTLSYSCY